MPEAAPTLRVRAALALVILLLSGAPLAASFTPSEAEPCPGFRDVPGQGPSCPVPGGWEVRLPDGRILLTHGPDHAPPAVAGASVGYPSVPPACTVDGSAKHVQLVYAHPSDRADASASLKPVLRDLVNRTNGHLRYEAQLLGDDMRYRFRCGPDGLVDMAVVHLSFPNGQATFSSITGALSSRGYNSAMAKYLVYYDGSIGGGVAGQGNVHNDDRLVAFNENTVGGDYALNYGYLGDFGAYVFSHEISHNLGAVQLSAPHTSGGWHCNDGVDTMCYADGGGNSAYTESACPGRDVFDCNHDDYFHPSPAPGSYLAEHWNVGSRFNTFLEFASVPNQAPEIRSLVCGNRASRVGQLHNCTFLAYDRDAPFGNGATPMNVTIDWGDGTQSVATDVPHGGYRTLGHVWQSNGTYTIRAWATDAGTPPLTGPAYVYEHAVACTYRSSNNMIVGLGGVETTFSSRSLAIPCAGQPFRLTGNAPNDFDVCWYAGETQLACHITDGNEEGMVPAGATSAHVILRLGALGAYNLYIDPAA